VAHGVEVLKVLVVDDRWCMASDGGGVVDATMAILGMVAQRNMGVVSFVALLAITVIHVFEQRNAQALATR
jgi:hypothetical protein